MNIDLKLGDCFEVLKTIEDNSIDSIVTDPPYGLSFMNKKWDYQLPSVDIWKECLRVLKPGGHLLSFGGSRTYHRMAVAVEDAGFEIRDQIMWIYASGFPKSHNLSKKIEQDIDNLIYNNIWKNKLDNVKIVEPTLKKSQIEVGNNMKKENSAHDNVAVINKEKLDYQNVIVVENNSTEVHHILSENRIVQESVGQFIIQQQDLVKCVEKLDKDQIVKLLNIFIVEESVKDMLREHSMNKIKVEEVQKTLNGNKKFCVLEIIPVLCVILPKILKHIILNQSRTFQSLDTKSQMDYVYATNVIITKSIMEHLIGNTVSILRKRIDFTIDTGHTALKPAHEPIVVARKPISEKTIAANVLKWKTGGINIDASRIPFLNEKDKFKTASLPDIRGCGDNYYVSASGNKTIRFDDRFCEADDKGRFPANLIFDEEAAKLLDEQSGISSTKADFNYKWDNQNCEGNTFKGREKYTPRNDKGGASRFFYCAKVSKKERNEGLEDFEPRSDNSKGNGLNRICSRCGAKQLKPEDCSCDVKEWILPKQVNNHPTVKPISLMSYLIKLVTPVNGTVLDPFMGSGSTGKAAIKEGFNFVGIEREKDYFEIAKARIDYEHRNKTT